MRSWRWYSKVLFALLVAAFAYWVWPTPWRYYTLENGTLWYMTWSKVTTVPPEPLSPVSLLVRQHRVTGRTEVFIGMKQRDWMEAKPKQR